MEQRVGAAPERLGLDLARAVGRQQHDARPARAAAHVRDELQAFGAVAAGQAQVGDDRRVVAVREQRLGLLGLARAIDLAAPQPEVFAHGEQDRLFVVHDE